MNTKLYKVISFCLVILWMIVIFLLSEMNGTESTNKSRNVVSRIITVFSHKTENTVSNNITTEKVQQKNKQQVVNEANISFRKFMHSGVYFVLALLVFNFINTFDINKKYFKYLWTLIFVFLYACTDEYHQTFVSGRTAEFSDILLDTLGGTIAIILIILITKNVKFIKIPRKMSTEN